MKQIFLSPRSNETAYQNYQSTLEVGIPTTEILPYIDESGHKILSNYETCYIWGATKGKQAYWNKMKINDYILFYSKGVFVQSTKVLYKTFNEELALKLWPRSTDGKPWSYIYFINNEYSELINFNKSEFIKWTGYKQNWILQGLSRIGDNKLKKILENFENTDEFINYINFTFSKISKERLLRLEKALTKGNEDDITESLDELLNSNNNPNIDDLLQIITNNNSNKKPETVKSDVKRIKRSAKLRNLMGQKHNYKCQICGFTFKKKNGDFYFEAAHITPMASRQRAVDTPNNILILCPNHHKMLDHGDNLIKIIDNKTIKVNDEIIKL